MRNFCFSLKPLCLCGFLLLVMCPVSFGAVTFIDVWQFKITGVTSVDAAELQKAVAPFTGAARTVEDIDKAATAVQRVYQFAGMQTVAVSVPEQDISNGIITIVVEETRIRRVRVKGSRYFSLQSVKDDMGSVSEGAVFNVRMLQKDVQKANQKTADLKIVPAVEPAPKPGYVDVDFNVTDKLPLHGGVEISNYHSATTTPSRIALDLRYANLWQKYHELGIQYQLSPENTDEVKMGALTYLAPMGKDARLAAYYIKSDSDIATVNDIRVFGRGDILGARWVQPLAQKRQNVQSLSFGFDIKDFDEDTFAAAILSAQSPVKYLTLSAMYSMSNNGSSGSDSVSAGFTLGSRKIVNDQSQFLDKRSSADSSFIYFRADWKHTYYLPKDWEISHRLGGQIAESPLVTNEQFSVGGVSTVRGYYESQVSGDSGAVANIELHAPDLSFDIPGVSELDLYWFLDGGWTNLKRPLLDEKGTTVISSTGLGFYSLLFNSVSLQVDGAMALEPLEGSIETELENGQPVPVGVVGEVKRGTFRVRASLRYDF